MMQIGANSPPGFNLRRAVNLALNALSLAIQENPGNIVTSKGSYYDYKVTAMYSPTVSGFPDSPSQLASGPQLAQGVRGLMEPSARSIFEYGFCALKSDSLCTFGIMTYQVVRGDLGPELKKRSAPNFANSSFTTGIHYLPINETVHAKIMPRPSPSNARVPLCKRDVDPTMQRCASMDTFIAGYKIKGETKLYSSNGFFMEFQSDQNMCTTHPNGHKYWCMMTQNGLESSKPPFTMRIEADGAILFHDKNGKPNGEGVYRGPKDFQYRLTMQNDGNLVFYRGMDNNYPIWASHPGNPPYPAPVNAPCTGKFLL